MNVCGGDVSAACAGRRVDTHMQCLCNRTHVPPVLERVEDELVAAIQALLSLVKLLFVVISTFIF
jgi:hypothetical protein